jgi:AraC-like DNA-binding protein
VLSQLTRGESLISRPSLSVKFVADGEERYETEGRTYRLTPGHLMIAEPGPAIGVSIRQSHPTLGLCVYLPAGAADAPKGLLARGPVVLPLVDHPLGGWLKRLAPRLAARPDLGERVADGVMTAARAGLADFVGEAGRRLDLLSGSRPAARAELLRRIELARAHLHAVRDRAVPLSELAAVAGVSPFHLARSFREACGLPPAAYHRALRMDDAARALAAGEATAAELTVRLGFSDQAAFTRAFARRHGRPPGRAGRRGG